MTIHLCTNPPSNYVTLSGIPVLKFVVGGLTYTTMCEQKIVLKNPNPTIEEIDGVLAPKKLTPEFLSAIKDRPMCEVCVLLLFAKST